MENNKSVKNLILNVGKDMLYYIPARLFPAIFGFIGLTIYTRIFSPNEFGVYSIIITTVGILGVFVNSWVNYSNLRFFSLYRDDNNLEKFFSTSFFILIGTITVSFLIMSLISKLSFLPKGIAEYLTLIIGILLTTSFFETTITILRSDRKPKAYSFFKSISAISCLVISLVLIFIFNLGISAILLGYILTYLLLSAIIIVKFKFYKYIKFNSFSTKTMKEFTGYGIPLIFTLIFSWILVLSDRYIIEYFRGSYEVGLYSAAYQLADYPVSLISSMIIMGAFPIIIDTWEQKDIQITNNLMSGITKYYLLLAIPILIGVIVLSQEFMILLDKSYSSGYMVLPWITFGSLMLGLCVFVNKGLELTKKTRVLSYIIAIAGFSNIVMNFLLIPKYGFYGAGIATGLAYIIYFLISLIVSKNHLGWIIPINSTKNILMCSILMGVVLTLIKVHLVKSILSLSLLIFIGLIIYLASIFYIGEIKNEVIYIRSFLISRIKTK